MNFQMGRARMNTYAYRHELWDHGNVKAVVEGEGTDKPLITHTPRWKEKSMGYHYVWVFGGGAYLSASGPQEG